MSYSASSCARRHTLLASSIFASYLFCHLYYPDVYLLLLRKPLYCTSSY